MDKAYPPRFWWLRRLCAAALILLLLLSGFHWLLTGYADRRLARIVDGWREDSQAPLPQMLQGAAGGAVLASGVDNAAVHYERAVNALPGLTQIQSDEWVDYDGRISPIPPEKVHIVREIVAAAGPELDLARQARQCELVDWNLPAVGISSSLNVRGIGELGARLGWAMMLAHYDGDLTAAIEYGRDVHQLGSANATRGPCLVTGVGSSGLHGLSATRFMDIAWHPTPQMSEDEQQEAWREAAPNVRAAIAELLDEQIGRTIMLMSWKGERVVTHSALATPALGIPPPNVVFRPILQADLARLLEIEDKLVVAMQTQNAQTIFDAATIDTTPGPRTIAGGISSLMFWSVGPSMERANVMFLRCIAQRRAAAVVLAAKLFYADHQRWPDSLEEMVPAYLPHVPSDPFAAPGAPLGFRTDAPLPIVYSVGEDLKDDGGSSAAPAGASAARRESLELRGAPFERRDLVYPLCLPPEALAYPNEFNIWNYLVAPQAEVERARLLELEREP